MKLEVIGVSKQYKDVRALSEVSICIQPGIYGLLGPNGSGKSTLMSILTANLRETSGKIIYNGINIHQLKEKYTALLGYAPQQQNLYPTFTGLRFMYYMAALKGMKKKDAKLQIEFLLKKVNLWEDAKRKIGHYSGGMKQRLLVAQALLGEPKVVLLDEPSAGLDPKERVHLRNLIRELSQDKIVIVTTHIVSDIESIADEIVFLKKGILKEVPWEQENNLETLYLNEFGNAEG